MNCTKNGINKVNNNLRTYIEEFVLPEYNKNEKAHGIEHIKYVIRRSFELVEQNELEVDSNMVYVIAAYHDIGHYIDPKKHELISADIMSKDQMLKKFFSDEQLQIIKEAIEDHSSSLEDMPRSDYGKLVSSADRNTRIEMVFIRSFFVAKSRTPDMQIEEHLDFTFNRLSKRYGTEKPENMFFEDETYRVFLRDMRVLLQDEEEFKKRYCEVNHIKSRNNKVADELGETSYKYQYDGEEH